MEDSLYEDWADAQREHLRQRYFDVTERLCELLQRQADYPAVIALCQKILAYDACYENAHRRLMRCYLAQRQRYLAARQYQHCEAALKLKTGLSPSAETAALYRQILT
jgi:DNA-binding SARP family transcriptional activator